MLKPKCPSRIGVLIGYLISLLAIISSPLCFAYRFAETIQFQQPDGTMIELRGHGNEFHARYETVDGYSVVFSPEVNGYVYATISEAGDELLPTRLVVGRSDPQAEGLTPRLQITPEARQRQAHSRKNDLDKKLRLSSRWSLMKHAAKSSQAQKLGLLRPGPTVGTKVGLTLLIDFDDRPSTTQPSAVMEFLNGNNYRANGNNGSVKQYFQDVSAGKLLYTNLVIGYIRIPASLHPRSYYNDLNRETSQPVNELVRDAIQILTNQPNYTAEIVPQLKSLTLDDAGNVLAANVFVTGADSGVWAKGIWPHMDALWLVGAQELWPGGPKVNTYQITTMSFQNNPLQIGTFCHESGHLLCGFPDVYDYDEQSSGGAGLFCLMNSNASFTNPSHVNPYFKLLAGWATVTDIVRGAATTHTLLAAGTNGNHFLRYRPNNSSREYYLIENRHQSGRDAQIPGSGILVWHIDELGNHNNENLLPNSMHANYEISLIQADGRSDLQKGDNGGDATDPFFQGNSSARYQNRFSDSTFPGAIWWNGRRSGLELRDFSAKGKEMTLTAEVNPPAILRDPLSQTVNLGQDLFLSIQMVTNQNYSYTWLKGSNTIAADERISGVDTSTLSIYSVQSADLGQYRVIVSNTAGYSETSRVAQVTISNLRAVTSVDLGDGTLMPGGTASLANSYQVTAGGSGLLGGADGCRFLSEKITGDFDVRLQVVDMNPEDGVSEVLGVAGLMVRESIHPGSVQSSVVIRPGFLDDGQVQALARPTRHTAPQEVARSGGISARDNWVRLKREGELVSMYYSTNGARWDWLKTVPVPLGAEAHVGMVASSYNPLVRITTGLRSYSLQTNLAPTFAIATTKNSAREGSDEKAILTIVSSRNGPLEVAYTLRDSALSGVAYERLSGTLTLPAGTNVASIEIVPIDDRTDRAPTVVSVTVAGSGVIQSSANVILFDNDGQGNGLKREWFSGIPGTKIADLLSHFRYPGSVQLNTVAHFEANLGQNSGQILSGYITPPVSGPYTFYIASANASELWLGRDTSEATAVMIAEELGTNTRRNWAGYNSRTHISAPITLEQGRWYYVKAIHKAGFGTPQLAVAWQPPGAEVPSAGSAPISGDFLTWSLAEPAVAPGTTLQLNSVGGQWLLSAGKPEIKAVVVEASNDLIGWLPIFTNSLAQPIDLRQIDRKTESESIRFYRSVSP